MKIISSSGFIMEYSGDIMSTQNKTPTLSTHHHSLDGAGVFEIAIYNIYIIYVGIVKVIRKYNSLQTGEWKI